MTGQKTAENSEGANQQQEKIYRLYWNQPPPHLPNDHLPNDHRRRHQHQQTTLFLYFFMLEKRQRTPGKKHLVNGQWVDHLPFNANTGEPRPLPTSLHTAKIKAELSAEGLDYRQLQRELQTLKLRATGSQAALFNRLLRHRLEAAGIPVVPAEAASPPKVPAELPPAPGEGAAAAAAAAPRTTTSRKSTPTRSR